MQNNIKFCKYLGNPLSYALNLKHNSGIINQIRLNICFKKLNNCYEFLTQFKRNCLKIGFISYWD